MGNARDDRAEALSALIAEFIEDAGPEGVIYSDINEMVRSEWGEVSDRQISRHLDALESEGRIHAARLGEDDDRVDNRRTIRVYRRGPSQENLSRIASNSEKLHGVADKLREAAALASATSMLFRAMTAREYLDAVIPSLQKSAGVTGLDVPLAKRRGRVH